MPFNEPALTSQEYATLWNWIYDGAPDANGNFRFPPNPDRSKWYIGHQICDEVAIFDAESRQIMRYIDVGLDPVSVEFTFDIQVSPDGMDWYLVFFGNTEKLLRFSAVTDEKIAEIELGHVGFSTLEFSHDGKYGFACSEYLSLMRVIDLEQNKVIGPTYIFDQDARGPTLHPIKKQIYLSQHRGNSLAVWGYDDQGKLFKNDSLDLIQGYPSTTNLEILPFEIQFLPDGSKYFVSCPGSEEIRVLDGLTDSLLEVISLPSGPSRMAYAEPSGRLFVSCMEDLKSWSGDPTKRGSVIVIDVSSHQIEKVIYSGFQPYAISADEDNGVLVVANRNTDITGPVPHHATYCEGRNGYVSLIDLNSLEVVPDFKVEILADPSTVAHR